jgi:integrase
VAVIADHVRDQTVARRLSTISGFFAYLLARGDVAANPLPRGLPTRRERLRPGQGVPLTRRGRRPPRVLTPADVFTAARRTHRGRAMMAAMVLGGLRRCEVLGLRIDDLRVAERRVFIADGKGGHHCREESALKVGAPITVDACRRPTTDTRCSPSAWTRACFRSFEAPHAC